MAELQALRAGQILPPGRLQRMQEGAFIETANQGLYTFTITATTTDPSPNQYQARWMRRGFLVTVWAVAAFQSGFTAGSGTYSFTMPFEPDHRNQVHQNLIVGDGRLRDQSTSANSQPVVCMFDDDNASDNIILLVDGSPTTPVGHNTPFAWVADDAISFRVTYLIDPRQEYGPTP